MPDEGPERSEQVPGTINLAIGRTIREMREARKLTARDLARAAGISPAMMSRIESGQVSPSLNVLELLASVLGTPIASFFRDTSPGVADFTIVRKGEGLKSKRILGAHVHSFIALGLHRRRDLLFDAVLVTLERSDAVAPPTYTGHGCVFIYVLSGEAIYRYGKEEFHLGEGDSLCLDAELRYGVQQVLTPQLRFLSVQAERRG